MSKLATLPHRLCSHLVNTSQAALAATSLPYSNTSLAITSILLRHGLVSNVTLGSSTRPDPSAFPTLPLPARHIWVNHKYRNGSPVLRSLNLVSLPSQRKLVTNQELGRILRGKRAKNVSGAGLGEVFVVKVHDPSGTRHGLESFLEGWEAWRAGLGGEVVCRAG